MSELKCCPFCGGKAEMLNYSPTEWLVHCIECDGMVENWRKTKQEAIEQWNTRTPMDNIVENIEKHLEEDSHNEYSSYYRGNYQMISAYDAINIVKQEMGVMNNEPTDN